MPRKNSHKAHLPKREPRAPSNEYEAIVYNRLHNRLVAIGKELRKPVSYRTKQQFTYPIGSYTQRMARRPR